MASFLKYLLKFKMLRKKRSRRSSDREVDAETKFDGSTVRRFNWEEIKKLTGNFSRVIGSGGFSSVYLAHFPNWTTLGAVKIHSSSERLSRVFKQELDILNHLRHENIVKFIGYCDDLEDQGVLVFEYVPGGTLQERLHQGGGPGLHLSWRNRMGIAFQLALAIEYLHDECDPQIVHCDIKSSNILLDGNLNCKLCDFGSAKMGFSSTVLPSSPTNHRRLMLLGSPGYVDPHYLRTGIASKKNDVYSFGVVLLELITGIEAFCEEKGQMLTAAIGGGERKVEVDPRLRGEYDLEEAEVMASMAAMCLQQSPTLRPSAAEILISMKHQIGSISYLFSSTPHSKKG